MSKPSTKSTNKGNTVDIDRRASECVYTTGPIDLSLIGRRKVSTGWLRDVSDGGFRAVHSDLVLRSGDRVAFRASAFQCTARVVWTLIKNNEHESGFLINESIGMPNTGAKSQP